MFVKFWQCLEETSAKMAKVQRSSLTTVSTPFSDAGIARPTLSEEEKPGKLQPIASQVLMKILFAARMARFDLIRATQSLASRVTKWSVECDVALHRLVCYINSTMDDLFLQGFIGDKITDCKYGCLHLRAAHVSFSFRLWMREQWRQTSKRQ